MRQVALGFLALGLVAGCKWVSDAQYDDRRNELEAFRTEFLPSSDQVRSILAVDQRFFWVSLVKPLDEPLMHSFDPATGTRIDYEFTRAKSNIAEVFRVSGQLVVQCGFSTAIAFDATMPNRMIEMTNMMVNDDCYVSGRDVYFVVARKLRKWTPGVSAPADVVDLAAQMVGTGTPNFGVLGNLCLYEEGGRLWQVDLTARTATWLENEPVTPGNVAFDERGVLFPTSNGIAYLRFSDRQEFLLDDLLADGGYELNGEYSEVQLADSGGDYTLYGKHIVYRGKQGIFAYGLESKKVIDLLLDGNSDEFDAHPRYRFPSVTADGTLFVWDNNNVSGGERPVYRVSLDGRLK